MCPVNLRVPPDASKKVDTHRLKLISQIRCQSRCSSVSLRIPSVSCAGDSNYNSAVTTPTHTPFKTDNSPKSAKKLKKIVKKYRIVRYKSSHKLTQKKAKPKIFHK